MTQSSSANAGSACRPLRDVRDAWLTKVRHFEPTQRGLNCPRAERVANTSRPPLCMRALTVPRSKRRDMVDGKVCIGTGRWRFDRYSTAAWREPGKKIWGYATVATVQCAGAGRFKYWSRPMPKGDAASHAHRRTNACSSSTDHRMQDGRTKPAIHAGRIQHTFDEVGCGQ